jgi:hypothetical protein
MSEFEDYNDVDETILDIDTSDAIEPACVEPGEYEIRITGFRKSEGKIVRQSDKGNKYFIVTFDIPSEEASKGFSKIFSIPTPDMEPKRKNSCKWDLDCFKRAFGMMELNFNDMVGKMGYAIIGKSTSEQYGEQNDIKKFVTGPPENDEY